jgi:hypothetical protein
MMATCLLLSHCCCHFAITNNKVCQCACKPSISHMFNTCLLLGHCCCHFANTSNKVCQRACRISIFHMFNTCLLLSNTGSVVYDGPQQLVLDYMAALHFACPAGENVADFLLDVTAGKESTYRRRHGARLVLD